MSFLSPRHFQYLVLQSCLGAAVVNAAVNGGIAWAQTRALPMFEMWTVPGVALDLVATAFGVTFGTFIAMHLQVRRDVARGKITAPALSPEIEAWFARHTARLPAAFLPQGALLGLVSIPFCLPLLAGLALCRIGHLDRASFIEIKAGFAALEGALVTPVIVVGFLLR
jgi:hypothetical protein